MHPSASGVSFSWPAQVATQATSRRPNGPRYSRGIQRHWLGPGTRSWSIQIGALELGEDEVDTLGEGMPELALCDLGAVCGADSQAALSVCVTVGACDGDLRERLLSSAAAMPERERMQREARQLGEAVRSGASARYGLRCRVVWCRPVTARAGAPLASGSTPLSGGRCLGAQRKASASAAW